ncbi:biliverdin-producing heme oxygenase [Dyadobacter subterraneus]|uniref:Biliverdin-producing heme oxygenase n=1 Tax=Dyadobacter subterraneus TaxID=2773304 RepID=A0ABR9W769_9BACT|nr:biliverdin-producing heme oxygenase [Dyadobacter subterraneus]MBE9461268.1 biliverdin-producing heme oxygenase [Dyadobacter subterraneus]
MNESVVSREKQELFLKDLRGQTSESHDNLEENKYSKVILDPVVKMSDYQLYIAKLYGVTKACENDIYPAISSVLTDIGQRFKSQLIEDDLRKTGFSKEQVANLPVFKFNPSSTADALGTMYVLEGSTLGGKILYKHINQVLRLNEETGASYFYGYGQQTGLLWKTFISTLANYAVEENCEQQIISSAISTFNAIGHWLNETEIN